MGEPRRRDRVSKRPAERLDASKRPEKRGARPRVLAVVAPDSGRAREAAERLAPRLGSHELRPYSLPRFRALREAPLSILLAPAGKSPEADREFFEAVRAQILWSAPPRDVYDAIAGVRTDLPSRSSRRGGGSGGPAAALLLEGEVDAARARAALASAARHWIVERAARVRLTSEDLAALAEHGVTWSAFEPVVLVGIASVKTIAKGLFPRGTKIWRV